MICAQAHISCKNHHFWTANKNSLSTQLYRNYATIFHISQICLGILTHAQRNTSFHWIRESRLMCCSGPVRRLVLWQNSVYENTSVDQLYQLYLKKKTQRFCSRLAKTLYSKLMWSKLYSFGIGGCSSRKNVITQYWWLAVRTQNIRQKLSQF